MLEDGAVYQDPADQVLESPAAPESHLVTIRLNGKSMTVPADVADALQEREQDFQRRLSAQGNELGQLRSQVQQLATVRERPADDSDPDLDYFRQPHQTIQQELQKQRQEIIQEVSQRYEQEKTRDRFWNTFYAQNPDLKANDWVVQATLSQEWSRLSSMSGDDAAVELAAATRSRISALAKPTGTRTDVPQGPSRTARTSTPSAPSQQREEPSEETYGLADVIAARRAARMGPKK